ncbi:MAG: hypothetical protein H0W13_07870 [Nitrospirales bacterium]|nr:hypothetical protein [Nitrospirales bacterium]
MDLFDWVLLRMYAWQHVGLIILIPLFLASLAAAVYVTREAYFKRTVFK